MNESRPPVWLTMATDHGPLVLFFLAYLTYDLMVATGVLMVAALGALALGWFVARHVPRIALVTATIVLVFGGLTLFLNDPLFIKIKPTIVSLLFAALLTGGMLLNRSPLQFVLNQAIDLDERGWRTFTWRYAAFFVFLALANEIVWRTQSEEIWVYFKVFGLLGLTILFSLLQIPLLMRHTQNITGDEAAETEK